MGIKKEGRKKKDQNVIFHQKTKPDDETYKSGVHNSAPYSRSSKGRQYVGRIYVTCKSRQREENPKKCTTTPCRERPGASQSGVGDIVGRVEG